MTVQVSLQVGSRHRHYQSTLAGNAQTGSGEWGGQVETTVSKDGIDGATPFSLIKTAADSGTQLTRPWPPDFGATAVRPRPTARYGYLRPWHRWRSGAALPGTGYGSILPT
ncbi:protein of unknown function [Magnetospirillum gryphiswaldense MSR-1 v2]|uniref:Uncharacterized protein n=1 Tax=Magnetospirillum gryphiswaldense (strain DSM 6361 / JCM 21280 / NBRC 15271 / MSR-1) TaxID=431944 RepID=V6F4Z8_MAGGM|nr:protein of unknown function [Magnetospirillum gryphiswaldense MSR-1 v2]